MRRSSLGWILQSWGPSATLSAGFVAARLCQTEPRVVACLNEDGEMFGQTLTAGPSVPSLEPGKLITAPLAIITVGELEFKDNADFQRLRKASRTVLFRYLEDRATHGFLVTIDRASMRHLGFSDIPLLTALSDQSANRGNLELIGSVILAFFNDYLAHTSPDGFTRALAGADGTTLQVFSVSKRRKPRPSSGGDPGQ